MAGESFSGTAIGSKGHCRSGFDDRAVFSEEEEPCSGSRKDGGEQRVQEEGVGADAG